MFSDRIKKSFSVGIQFVHIRKSTNKWKYLVLFDDLAIMWDFFIFFLQNLFSRTLLAVIICALLDKYKGIRSNKLKPRVCVEYNNNNNKQNNKNNASLYSNNNDRTKANHFNSQSISFLYEMYIFTLTNRCSLEWNVNRENKIYFIGLTESNKISRFTSQGTPTAIE